MSAAVVLAADAGPDDGLGHLSRSTALACALGGDVHAALALGASEAIEIDGIAWEPTPVIGLRGAGALVLDSYRVEARERAALAGAVPLAEFEDRGEAIAGRLAIGPLDGDADDERRVAGPRFACLRRELWERRAEPLRGALERVLVTTGGGDPTGAAADYAVAVRAALPDSVTVVWARPAAGGDAPPGVDVLPPQPSLTGELARADLVVSGAGMTMVEAAALGRPCIAIALAHNQQPGRARFASAGAVATADDPESLEAAVERLAGSPDERAALAARAAALVDGRGALRVAERVRRLAGAS